MSARSRSAIALFVLCGVALSACAREPASPPTVALKTTPTPQPVLPAAELRTRMLTLVDSLKTHDDTDVAHVEQVIGVKLIPNPKWDQQMRIFGDLKEGWSYTLEVNRYDKDSDAGFYFFPDGEHDPGKFATQVCSYDANAVAKELVEKGYTRFNWPQAYGSEIWGFERPAPSGKFWFQIAVYVYHVTDGANRSSPRPCIRSLKIVSGDEQ